MAFESTIAMRVENIKKDKTKNLIIKKIINYNKKVLNYILRKKMFPEKIDIYGSKPGFTINKKLNFKTNFGGYFTILTVFIYILLFNLLAKDFYLKINPIITSEKIFITDRHINNFTITNHSFLFAIDSPSRLKNPKLYKFFFKYKKEYNLDNQTTMDVDFITCDKTPYSKMFDIYAESMFCINYTKIMQQNLTNFSFLDNVQSNSIKISMEYNYDYLDKLNETYKQSLFNLQEYVFFYYPVLLFSPNNKLNPLDIQLDYNQFIISQKTEYSNDLRYAETEVEEDDNIIFDSKQIIDSEIHVVNQVINYETRTDKKKPLATFTLFLDGLYYSRYTRVYKKIPDILAEVLGIMHPLVIAFSYLVRYFTQYNLDNLLIDNFLCYFSKDHNKIDNIIWQSQNYQDFKKVFKKLEMENLQNSQSVPIHKNREKKKIFYDYSNEKISDSYNKQSEEYSENRLIKDTINRSFTHGNKTIQNQKDLVNEINIELVENINQENDKVNDGKTLNKIASINKDVDQKKDEMRESIDFFGLSYKVKNNFPSVGIFDYYFPLFISKKDRNYKSRTELPKILKFFSSEIFNKLDLLYYLKLVRKVNLLKNVSLTKKVEKETLKFLTNSLYFVRDCDFENIVQEIDQRSK